MVGRLGLWVLKKSPHKADDEDKQTYSTRFNNELSRRSLQPANVGRTILGQPPFQQVLEPQVDSVLQDLKSEDDMLGAFLPVVEESVLIPCKCPDPLLQDEYCTEGWAPCRRCFGRKQTTLQKNKNLNSPEGMAVCGMCDQLILSIRQVH